ncbi:hypothetical protein DKP84_14555 [Acinetobacter pittii]|nr:hypothetical protein DKP84_14555 [Acinetobacter pittii]
MKAIFFSLFGAKDLTHSERIEIILEVERTIRSDTKKRIHLIWDNGFSSSDLTIWSESHTEQTLAMSSIENFFRTFEMIQYPLPAYLNNKINTSANFLVFPSENYIQRFIKQINVKS